MMVKVLVYAYATGVFSSRKIERRLHEDLALRMLAAGNFPRHRTICDFRAFHVICDNVSSHKTDLVEQFLVEHEQVRIHYTPTYSSWLNQVENWFSRIQRDVITRGVFTSVKDLDKKLMRYIRQYNKSPKPLKWKYDDPSRRHRQFF
jgi:hypothetical protein